MFEMSEVERTLDARDALFDFFRPLIAERRRRPRADLISALAAGEAGDGLSELELLAMLNLLLVAGHETTVNLLTNGLLALLRHSAELERLRAEPELVPSAVEEMLRFDSPVQMDGRIALEDAEIADQRVPAGTPVIAVLGAANRDPEMWSDPDRFDVARSPNRHLAFGMGVHFCLGAPLARLEGNAVFGLLIERFRRIELAGQPELRPTIVLRGRSRLPVKVAR
jgi:cytochrome P450